MNKASENKVVSVDVLPHNFLPVALSYMRDDELKGENRSLIPIPIQEVNIPLVSGSVIADPEELAGKTKGLVYIGPRSSPKMETLDCRFEKSIESESIAPITALAVIDTGIAFWNKRFTRQGKDGLTTRFKDFGTLRFGNIEGLEIPEMPRVVQFYPSARIQEWTELGQTELGEAQVMDEIAQDFPAGVFHTSANVRAPTLSSAPLHGTMAADLAFGSNPGDAGPVLENPLIGIELPADVLSDTSGDSLQIALNIAMRAIANRVNSWNPRPEKVAINLSYAFLGGPHNQSHPVLRDLEQLIDEIKAKSGLQVELVVPMGNHLQDKAHFRLAKSIPINTWSPPIRWKTYPDDHTSNTVEILYSAKQPANIEIQMPDKDKFFFEVELPDKKRGHHVQVLKNNTGSIIGAIHIWHYVGETFKVRISLCPTATDGKQLNLAPSGEWKIKLFSRHSIVRNCRAWIVRDDGSIPSRRMPPARSSEFVDDMYKARRENGHYAIKDQKGQSVTRAGTASLLASSRFPAIHVVEALEDVEDNTRRPVTAYYSGAPYSDKVEPNSELVDEGRVSRGCPAAGNGSDRQYLVSGTSVAAAKFTRRRFAKFTES